MRFCEECGAKLDDTAVCCQECGTKVVEEKAVKPDIEILMEKSEKQIRKKEKNDKNFFSKMLVLILAMGFMGIFVLYVKTITEDKEEMTTDFIAGMTEETTSELNMEVTEESTSELLTEVTEETTSELLTEVIEESTSELLTEVTEEITSELLTEVIEETTTEINYEEFYQSVMEKHQRAIQENWQYDKLVENGMSYVYGYYEDLSEIGYVILDVDGNGVKELLIGCVPMIYNEKTSVLDMYTLVNGIAVHVCSGEERLHYYICEDGRIEAVASGGADYNTYSYFSLMGGIELKLEEKMVFDSYEGDFYQEINDFRQYYTEEQAKTIVEGYKKIRLSYTSFAS